MTGRKHVTRSSVVGLTVCAVLLFAAAPPARAAAPPAAPVTITYSPVPNAKQNESVSTTIAIRADGVEITSSNRDAAFDSVKNGDTRSVAVSARLTDAHAGTIVVFVKAVSTT